MTQGARMIHNKRKVNKIMKEEKWQVNRNTNGLMVPTKKSLKGKIILRPLSEEYQVWR